MVSWIWSSSTSRNDAARENERRLLAGAQSRVGFGDLAPHGADQIAVYGRDEATIDHHSADVVEEALGQCITDPEGVTPAEAYASIG